MIKLTSLARWLSVVLAAVGLSVSLGATPAQAAYSNCPTGYVCGFNNIDGQNLLFEVYRSPGTCYNLIPETRNMTDSFYNHMTWGNAMFYNGLNCTGQVLKAILAQVDNISYPPGYHANFYAVPKAGGSTARNRLESIWFTTGCTCLNAAPVQR